MKCFTYLPCLELSNLCMECEEDGFGDFAAAGNGGAGVERERHGGARELQLDVAAAVPAAPDQKPVLFGMDPAHENFYWKVKPSDTPFMNNMEEISYWVHTKRAPCLYTYDQTNNKPKEQAHCSKYNSKCKPVKEVPSPRKKNKRKLALMDQDSVSSEKEPSAFYFTSDTQQQVPKSNLKASSNGSDADFIIKKSSTVVKPKRMRLQKKSKMDFEKKNKMVTSTPKVTALRRSLRKLQKSLNDNQLDSTIKVINNTLPLEPPLVSQVSPDNQTPKLVEDETKTIVHDVTMEEPAGNNATDKVKLVHNGKLEDDSDVSGFTANYIRSTKTQLLKTPRNMRSKLNKTFIKESQESPQKQESKTVVCVNKSMNTGPQDSAVLNYSTDSSQNVINLVTSKQNSKVTRVSRSTSLLKFMNPKQSDNKQSESNDDKDVSNVDETPQSNGTSRYPKRQRNCNAEGVSPVKVNSSKSATDRRKRMCKKPSEFTSSDRKENSEEEIVYRTRSGRKVNQKVAGHTDNSVLVLSNSTEQLSSMAAVNVAGPTETHLLDNSAKKKRQSGRCTQLKKSAGENRQLLKRDSRDRSGFTACFSDSDEDFESKQRKFFC